MPLLGMVDPSHKERAWDAAGRPPKWVTVDDILATAREKLPKWSPWPYELIKAAVDEQQERDYISTTMLVGGCSRSKVLERKEPYIDEVDDLYASLRGTQIHRTLEYTARPGALAEGRFFTTLSLPKVGNVELSCSPDIVTADGQLGDYKVTESPPLWGYMWENHKQQLNINRYVVNHAEKWDLPPGVKLEWNPRELNFGNLYIVYLGPKGPKVIECTHPQEVTYKNGRKDTKAVAYVQTDAEVEEYLIPRMRGMVLALKSYPAWPEGLEEFDGFEGPELPEWLIQAHLDNGAPDPRWKCPGKPWCKLPNCLAKRYPYGMRWDNPPDRRRRVPAE